MFPFKEIDSILLSLVFFLFFCIIKKDFLQRNQKGQVNDLNYSVFNEVKYINQLFGLVLQC